jgi:hypothetical protein
MSMRHRLPALLGAAMLLVMITAPAQARSPQQSRHEQIVAHWTAARLAAAVPRDFTYDPARGFVQRAKPERPPGGGGGGATTGASWNGGGAIKEATGKVYFETEGGAFAWVCSGAVATDGVNGRSLVLTAAHCAYDEENGQFVENWLFIPDFDQAPTFTCAQTEYGCWTAQALVVHSGYTTAGGFNTQATLHDFAFAVVGAGGTSGSAQLDAAVGSFPLSIGGFDSVGDGAYAFGYRGRTPVPSGHLCARRAPGGGREVNIARHGPPGSVERGPGTTHSGRIRARTRPHPSVASGRSCWSTPSSRRRTRPACPD